MDLSRIYRDERNVRHLAIGICDYGQNTHTGVVHRDLTGTVRFLEQGFHYRTRNNAARDSVQLTQQRFLFVGMDLEDDRARVVAGMCRLIGKHLVDNKLSGLPYALKFDESCRFDQFTGELILSTGIGLSCSTFVVVVFRSCRIQFIDFEGWPQRSSDVPAQKRLVKMLEDARDAGDATDEHVEKVRKEIGCVRARPEEVAGVCLLNLPGRYPAAEVAGAAIMSVLKPSGAI